jgi:5-methylcytosine-specific restriction enzyme A
MSAGPHAAVVTSRKRWKAVRWKALQRDGFKCVKCGARGRLEVDHVLPVRTHPHLAYELGNTQSLCVSCHSKKTIQEIGLRPINPAREAWLGLVRSL